VNFYLTQAERRGVKRKTFNINTLCLILLLERTALLINFDEFSLLVTVKMCCYMSLKYSDMDKEMTMAIARCRMYISADEGNALMKAERWSSDSKKKLLLLFNNELAAQSV